MSALLKLDHIYKDYMLGKERVPILKDVCLEVEQGDYIAIMGPSGSGKTTLMNIMGCLDVPSAGDYWFDGENTVGMSDNRRTDLRSAAIGFVFQSFYLLPKLTAQENAALPLLYRGVKKKARLEQAAKALTALGLGERLQFYPNQLSGGQQQRVAIARAMSAHPKVLFADEPTGALDTASGQQIMELFDKLNRGGATIIMITHEPDVAAQAKTRYSIRDGVLRPGTGGDAQ